MSPISQSEHDEIIAWCESVLGSVEVLSDHTREHPGERASITRLRAAVGDAILKFIPDPAHWDSEVHSYEHWAQAFGPFAPRLIAVRENAQSAPGAVLISALPGRVLEDLQISDGQSIEVWRSAGKALRALHSIEPGPFFGPLRRDGSPREEPVAKAQDYVAQELERWTERGLRLDCLLPEELAVVRAAQERTTAFLGERPTACHRDYCPANWLVTDAGEWAGVIDFEFAYWDVRATDFTRYPNWEWIDHPERIAAFFEGYGRALTPAEEEQRLVCHVQYALAAVVWGMENDYFGFAAEGRRAFEHLAKRLP